MVTALAASRLYGGAAGHGVRTGQVSVGDFQLSLMSGILFVRFKKRTGIFECNHFAVYSDGPAEPLVLGEHADGSSMKTIPIPGPCGGDG